jgi:hypothetical protein
MRSDGFVHPRTVTRPRRARVLLRGRSSRMSIRISHSSLELIAPEDASTAELERDVAPAERNQPSVGRAIQSPLSRSGAVLPPLATGCNHGAPIKAPSLVFNRGNMHGRVGPGRNARRGVDGRRLPTAASVDELHTYE